MSSKIFEEEGRAPVAGGMATAQQKIEKQARQLAYDTRYQVKKEIGGKTVSPAAMKRLLLQRLQKSSAAPNVKLRAKQMLLGEDYIGNVSDFASDRIANALLQVFVEGTQQEVSEDIQLEYLKELDENPDKKYKVRVTDKKTGNSYVRYATREKIGQLRANPNIQSVEMTEYGEPREGERKGGEDTARATGGGKAKKDYDLDGTIESGAKEHAGAVHNAIQRKKGLPADGKDTTGIKEELVGNQKNIDVAAPYGKLTGADFKKLRKRKTKKKGVAEEFLSDAASGDPNPQKITITKNVNNYAGKNPVVTIMPEDQTAQRQFGPRSVYAHYEAEGEVIAETGYSKFLKKVQSLQEKAESEQQQKLFGLALSVKRGQTPRSEVSAEVLKIVDTMSEKKIRDFAKTKHEGLPKKKVNEECGCEEEPKTDQDQPCMDDPRSLKTKINLAKNKLRAMGLKMSYEPEGELVDEARASEKRGMGSPEQRSDVSRTGYLSGTRAQNRERGERGGRHHYSGSVEYGGSEAERGRKKVKGAKGDENKYTQHGRIQVFQGRTETSGKYSEMQRRKRGGDIGSRFD